MRLSGNSHRECQTSFLWPVPEPQFRNCKLRQAANSDWICCYSRFYKDLINLVSCVELVGLIWLSVRTRILINYPTEHQEFLQHLLAQMDIAAYEEAFNVTGMRASFSQSWTTACRLRWNRSWRVRLEIQNNRRIEQTEALLCELTNQI